MGFLIPAIAALAGGALNAFSEGSKRSAMNSRIDEFINEFRTHMLDPKEIQGKINRTNSIFNSSLNSIMNRTAYNTRSLGNAPVAKAGAASAMESNRLNAVNDVYNKADNYNLDIISKIGQLNMSKQDGNFLGDFIPGAIQGGIAGSQIDYLTSGPEVLDTDFTKTLPKANYTSLANMPLNSPTIPLPDIGMPKGWDRPGVKKYPFQAMAGEIDNGK